jgi:predicted amidophosphoribosyltransferase
LSFKPSFIQMRSAVIYNAKGAALLKAFKCADHWRLGDWLIQRMEEVAHTLPLADLEAIIPMPLALGKHWTRSYSTAHWLAKGLARRLGLRYHALGLLRIPSLRPHQHRLQRADRLALDAALFWAHRASVKGRYLLLVDDVATTGATARAASTALLKAGARGVYVLTAARTPRWVAGPTVPAPSCSARIP